MSTIESLKDRLMCLKATKNLDENNKAVLGEIQYIEETLQAIEFSTEGKESDYEN